MHRNITVKKYKTKDLRTLRVNVHVYVLIFNTATCTDLSEWILPDVLVQNSPALTRVGERDNLFQQIDVPRVDVDWTQTI